MASGLFNPLDVRGRATGRIYVAEYGSDPEGEGGHITLLSRRRISLRASGEDQLPAADVRGPSGYSKDYGQAYDAARGFGWVAPGTTTPRSLVGLARERNLNSNQLLDIVYAHPGQPRGSSMSPSPSAWLVPCSGDKGTAVKYPPVRAETTVVIPPSTLIAGRCPARLRPGRRLRRVPDPIGPGRDEHEDRLRHRPDYDSRSYPGSDDHGTPVESVSRQALARHRTSPIYGYGLRHHRSSASASPSSYLARSSGTYTP